MKYLISFLLLIFLLSACSTTKQKSTTGAKFGDRSVTAINPNHFATNDNLLIKASLSINFPGQKNSASSTIEIAGLDSLLIKITAFLGISVGQLYATPNEFIMNNNFESTTYVGIPSEENIMKAAFIPFSYNDLVCILKSIPTQNISEYKYRTENNVFEYLDANKRELIYFNNFFISKIVRFDKKGNEIFSVEYSDFATFGEKKLAKKISVRFMQQGGNIAINYSDIQFKATPTSPMKIVKPRSYKLQEF